MVTLVIIAKLLHVRQTLVLIMAFVAFRGHHLHVPVQPVIRVQHVRLRRAAQIHVSTAVLVPTMDQLMFAHVQLAIPGRIAK